MTTVTITRTLLNVCTRGETLDLTDDAAKALIAQGAAVVGDVAVDRFPGETESPKPKPVRTPAEPEPTPKPLPRSKPAPSAPSAPSAPPEELEPKQPPTDPEIKPS